MRVCAAPPAAAGRASWRRCSPVSRPGQSHAASRDYSGPTAADAATFQALRCAPSDKLEAALSAASAAGQLQQGVLEVALQHLQVARRDSAQAAQVPHLEALARLTGLALLRQSPPPAAALLSPLVEAARGGASDEALQQQLRHLTALPGFPAAGALADAAAKLVTAYETHERTVVADVARAVEEGGPGAEAALAAAEQRQQLRAHLARIGALAQAM